MKKSIFSAVVFLFSATAIYAQSTLGNSSIIEMKKAGLSDEIIKTKIATEESNFDTSTNAILELKNNQISDEMISLMIQKNAALKAYQERDDSENLDSENAILAVTSIREIGGKLEIGTATGKTLHLSKGDILSVYLPYNGSDFVSIEPKKSMLGAKMLGSVADVVGTGALAVGVGSNNLGTTIGALKVINKASAVKYGADALQKVNDLSISKNAKKIAGKDAEILEFNATEDGYVAVVEIAKKKYNVNIQYALMTGEVKLK